MKAKNNYVSANMFDHFLSCTVHFDTTKVFIYQMMHNRVALKEY